MKDKGMKWVIVADVMALIVVGLLVWASKIEKEMITTDRAELAAILKERQKAKTHSEDHAHSEENTHEQRGEQDAAL